MLPLLCLALPLEIDLSGARYSAANQITRENVGQMKPAWTFHTKELPIEAGKGPSTNWEATPILVGRRLVFPTPQGKVFAIDAATGTQDWVVDTKTPVTFPKAKEALVSRGVGYWPKGNLIFFGTNDGRLVAINAETGGSVPSFPTVDLRASLGTIDPTSYTITSPPIVVGDTVVIGSCIADNQTVDAASGVVRGFDAQTGHLKWAWDSLGRSPKRTGPFPQGAANAWTWMSADPDTGLVFVPTGSQSPDFYGGLRPGDNRDANSVTALDAESGKKVWSFQVVHHDLWDYDVPAQPILADFRGKKAVIALTKMGTVFVLDRLTGKPLIPVEERPVPASDVPGELTSKTQPFPTAPPPLVPHQLSEDDVWGVNESARNFVLAKVKGKRNEGIFTPPSLQGTVLFPGNIGGANWSGGSWDGKTLYVNTNRLATLVTLFPTADLDKVRKAYPGAEIGTQSGAPYGVRRDWLYGPNMIPGTRPPWGTLTAVDLDAGTIRWQKPLGFLPALAGVKGSSDYGSINLGGSCVTATGLLFIAATQDENLRAFDTQTGEVLWKTKLPAGGNAAPLTYAVDGKQYVVICAGGHHGLRTRYGDSVVAYSLP